VAEVRVSEFVELHSQYAKTQFAPKTVEVYRFAFKSLLEFLGDADLSSITSLTIEQYKAQRLQKVSRESVNIELRALKAAFNRGLDWGVLTTNPFGKVKQIPTTAERPEYLRVEELEFLLSVIRKVTWLKDVVVFAVNTGLRRGEICNLKWERVDLKNRVITVQSDDRYRVKMGKFRIVPLNARAYEVLKKRFHQRNSDYVFTSEHGQKINADFLSKRFKRYLRLAGLGEEIHFHSLRHTFASLLAQARVPLYEIKELLGHSKISVTEQYSHLSPQTLQKAVQMFPVVKASQTARLTHLRPFRGRPPTSRSASVALPSGRDLENRQQGELF
jgi:integrase